MKKREKYSQESRIIEFVKIYAKEEYNMDPIIIKNNEPRDVMINGNKKKIDKTYGLEIIRKPRRRKFFEEDIEEEELDKISEEMGYTNLKPLNNVNYYKSVRYIFPKNRIKESYTQEEFDELKEDGKYVLFHFEDAYEECENYLKNKETEIIHSKRCKCKECSNKK